MGFWNDVGEWIEEKWDDATDWLNEDNNPSPVEHRVDDGDLSSVPTKEEVRENLNTLRPFLLEGYRRQGAFDRFGLDVFKTHNDNVQVSEIHGGYLESSGQKDFRSIDAFYRWSDRLGFYMPMAIPDDLADDYPGGEQKQASWPDSTSADDTDIEIAAQDSADTAMGKITAAYDEVLAQCDVPAMQELLSGLNAMGSQVDAIKENHYETECKEILDLWNGWEDTAAEAAIEVFGGTLRDAVNAHRTGAWCLMWSASAEASAQASATIAAYNHGADAWEKVTETLHPTVGSTAASKLTGSIIVNRIPFAGDVVAMVDFAVEIGSDGKVQSALSGGIAKLVNKLGDGKGVPDGESCEEIVSMLETGAEECLEFLKDERTDYVNESLLENEATEWDSKWGNGTVFTIIPGYLDD